MSSNTTNRDPTPTRVLESFTEKMGRRLNHNFCPSFDRYVYWIKRPVGWIICGVAVSGLAGLLVSSQAFAFMWSLIAFLIVGVTWPWLSLKGVTCVLKFDQSRSREGQRTVATLEVVNRWPIPVFGLMVIGEFLQEIIKEDDRVAIGLQRIPAWSTSQFCWEFEPQRRGVLPADQPSLKNGFPFGLYDCQKSIEVDGQTIVWPGATELQGFSEVQGAQFDIDGLMSDRSGTDGDVIGVRNFRNGDSLRHINWAKTAAQGRLIVQERQTCAQRPIQVLVDLTAENHRGASVQSSYEWTIRIAASVCQQLHRHRSQVVLKCLGLPSDIQSKVSNQKGMKPLLDFLAMLPAYVECSSEEQVTSVDSAGWTGDDQLKTICIKTSLSQFGNQLKDAHNIVVDVEQFERVDSAQQNLCGEASPPESLTQRKQVVITAPEKAADELRFGWQRSCEHVA